MNVESTHSYPNFVGNVLGGSGLSWTSDETGATRDTSGGYVWSWGFHLDGGTTRVSTTPRDTALRGGNYSAYTQQATWDASITDHNIPASLYLSSKPAFFGALPWPAIGPELNPMVGRLPAKDRYDGNPPPVPPPAPTNLRLISNAP